MSEEHRIALVTGASRGIGQAIAFALANTGVMVVGTATSQGGADNITQGFSEAGLSGVGRVLDVCNNEQIKELLAEMKSEWGSPEILVNNAGITKDNIVLRMRPNEWDDVIQTNLNAVYHLTKACIKPMFRARFGRIINISSVSALMGNIGQANYAAAKAGMIGFTKSLAQEMATRGITANAVAPGFIQTDMIKQMTAEQQALINERVPMGRVGLPEEVAAAVVFLASDHAAYITGQTLSVNGGLVMP